jgi:hypothetical protein
MVYSVFILSVITICIVATFRFRLLLLPGGVSGLDFDVGRELWLRSESTIVAYDQMQPWQEEEERDPQIQISNRVITNVELLDIEPVVLGYAPECKHEKLNKISIAEIDQSWIPARPLNECAEITQTRTAARNGGEKCRKREP